MDTNPTRQPQSVPPPVPARPPQPTTLERPSPLTAGDFMVLAETAKRFKTIGSAAKLAQISSISMLCIGALALPWSLVWPSFPALFVIAGILAAGAVEYSGRRRLLRAEPSACRLLAWNQVGLLIVITIYCLMQMAGSQQSFRDMILSPEFREQLGSLPNLAAIARSLDELAPMLVCGFYSLVILCSIAAQGGMAWYYRSKQKALETYARQSPAWARQLLEIARSL